ncbi:MAG: polysaccharide pyruvyl transferase family protein [Ginsengibacter sp.]
MAKVFLVTKLQTTNLGNQALSMELIKLFEENIGKENLYVAGRPLGLLGYSINKLKASPDPVKLFESWADAVVKKYRPLAGSSNVFKPRINDFSLSKRKSLKLENFKRWLRPFKRAFDRFFLFDKQYVKRLNAINVADFLIYSGAGEASDNHVFLRQMLELRVAQKLGKKTGAVNQSVVVRNEAFKKIVNLVYGNMNHVVVRGNISRDVIIDSGVNKDKVSIAPDTAIKTNPPGWHSVKKTKKVAINIHEYIDFTWKDIETILDKLKQYNREIVYVTNEPLGDNPTVKKFRDDFNIPILEDSSGYLDFTNKLAEFDYLIAVRLHSNIMALAVNVPVIPIEGLVWKTTELFDQLEYPIKTINVKNADWLQSVLNAIDDIENKKIDFDGYFRNVLPRFKENVSNNVNWINNN